MIIIKNGRPSGLGTLIASGFISILSLLVVLKSYFNYKPDAHENSDSIFGIILGTILFIVFISPFFITEGIIFDFKKNVFLVYTKIFGYKTGKWLSLNTYNSFSIIQSRKSGRVGRVTTLGVSETSYNLIIMDSSHRQKKTLKTFQNFDEAKVYAEDISKKTELPLVKYAPKKLTKNTRR